MVSLALALLSAPLAAEAQAPGRVSRVGVLRISPEPFQEAFPLGLRDLGYVEGKDLLIEWRSADRADRLPVLAAGLVRLGVDVILALGPEARQAAAKATSIIPIVTISGGDPVAEGWAVTLGRPGGNLTGMTVTYPELYGKQMELLKEALPTLSRVAVLWDSGNRPLSSAQAVPFKNAINAAGQTLGVKASLLEVWSPDDLERAVQGAKDARAEALQMFESAMLLTHRARLAELSIRHRLPAIGIIRQSAEAGFLMTYSTDLHELHRRAAAYVVKILRGARPGELPVERPAKFELAVSVKTAKVLGLTVPPSLLTRAGQIIE